MKSTNNKLGANQLPVGEIWFIEPISSNLNEVLTDSDYGNPEAMAHTVKCRLRDGQVVDRIVFRISRRLAEIFYAKQSDYHFVLFGARREGLIPREFARSTITLGHPSKGGITKGKVIVGSSLLRKMQRRAKVRDFGVH